MSEHIEEYEWNGEGSYILEGQTPKGWVCLDVTRRMGSVDCLLNHSLNPNLKPFRPLHIREKWRVGFLAVRDIKLAEELTWDYSSPQMATSGPVGDLPQECSPCGVFVFSCCFATN